ncbi:AEC family transporter [Piscinibacter sakaiensis]|uniref:Putative mdcF malonate transporter n=1 Tax=Piscinibacter sakaiensis TaxID=1547922 RepID=A0A0K8NYN5_PISS1|nr:AEC family transporter [Piscinibacter sakaiensis]GAP35483.1 putative mdcF malonate transporter [Piscinibacter sakaiensis]
MSLVLLTKLLAIVAIVALGYLVGRARWLSPDDRDGDPARTLSYAAFYIFVPALLLRTTARIDLAALPWRTLAAFFLPVVAVMGAVYLLQRRRPQARQMPAAPSVRALSCVFGNTVQVGVPLSAALFGEAGLALHVTLVSLHALTLLTLQTAAVELDLARAGPRAGEPRPRLGATLAATARNTLVHPVVLPVLAGLAWNLGGLGIPGPVDEVLATLGAAVVPLCLVLIGMSLAYYDVGGAWRAAAGISVVKLLLLPALVLAVGHGLFGLRGLPLAVITVAAALPAGSNALLFAQRYDTLQAEASAAIVVSTLAFALTVPAWLAVLAALGALG